jgi:hypothetical protein
MWDIGMLNVRFSLVILCATVPRDTPLAIPAARSPRRDISAVLAEVMRILLMTAPLRAGGLHNMNAVDEASGAHRKK